ncbi:MAG: hypothetical protein A3J75_03535 [Acidobacteria bacterium RBG_16_68_9]|nr:MAG: hypothetical protein A3J75_03535 [Acidobacteria bacterium RBG_16_68_9]
MEIFVRADNGSASSLRNVRPNPLQLESTGTASLRLMTRRKVRRELICNNAVTFKWQGILRGTGTVTVAVEVIAAGPAGVPATTGLLACGTFATQTTAGVPEATR